MKIVYYSASGNTEKMANLIAEGIANGGKTAEVINVSNANADIFDNEEISKPDVEIIPPTDTQPEVETPEAELPEKEESKEEIKEMTNLDYVEHFHDHLTVIDSGIETIDIPPMPVIRTEVSFKYDGPYKIKFINVELSYYKFEETQFGVQPILLQDLSTYKVSFQDTAKGVDDTLVFTGFDNLEAQLAVVDILSIELEDGTIINFDI